MTNNPKCKTEELAVNKGFHTATYSHKESHSEARIKFIDDQIQSIDLKKICPNQIASEITRMGGYIDGAESFKHMCRIISG